VNGPKQKSKLFLKSKQKTNFEEKKEKIKSAISQKKKLEANILQNTRILESWKLLTKSKLQYFPKILGVEKPIK